MIVFACKQCGKRHARAEEEAGSLVFCECGQGNRVPWESALPPGEAPAGTPAPVPEALRVDDDEADAAPTRRARRWRDEEEWDPAYCFNHRDTPSRQTCAACDVALCDDCVVVLEGATLCGPCKNMRIRRLHRPSRLSLTALFSVIVALAGGPVSFCVLITLAAGVGVPAVGFGGLLAPLLAIALGAIALKQIEKDPHVGGRALAITGIVAGLVGAMMAGIMTVLLQYSLM
ncbi:MAG TPA: hypothetical protein VG013_29610 [Gemmataceae bacterium]|jgi:hypothetical protein|nr:hypothetical protein [Gemmataceae bacterium]